MDQRQFSFNEETSGATIACKNDQHFLETIKLDVNGADCVGDKLLLRYIIKIWYYFGAAYEHALLDLLTYDNAKKHGAYRDARPHCIYTSIKVRMFNNTRQFNYCLN